MLRSTFALASVWLCAASASANGAYTHVHISPLAHARLPPAELWALLDEQTHAYECGSLFPDSGDAIGVARRAPMIRRASRRQGS